MLVELSIKNVAIIEELTISFERGLTVLTGETGAGKSIIIDAIGLLVGGRGSAEFVRYGENRAEIEGLFTLEDDHPAIEKALSLGIEVEDNMLILRRDISAAGKSICRINGKLVTLAILRELGQTLIDIHGQHEHQILLQPEQHLSMLDSFAKGKLAQTLHEYKQLFKRYQGLAQQLKTFTENEQEIAQRLDLIQYQLKEIELANLVPNEDEELVQERHKLANSEKLYHALHEGYHSLYGEGKGLDWIGHAMGHLEEAASIDSELKGFLDSVSNAFYALEETTFALRDQFEQVEFNPEKLNLIESRLSEINQLKRKYGASVTDILEYSSRISDELDTLLHKDDRIMKLKEELEQLMLDLRLEADALTAIRKQTAKLLIEEVCEELKALYMEKTKFDIVFKQSTDREDSQEVLFTERGCDQIEFFISTNPGEPLKPLVKVASGGEISRIMLALKSIFSDQQGVTSIIFDEVDTGVSGRVAQAIAEKIKKVSFNSQVLCITHLPQVAAMADHHLFIAKNQQDDRTQTTVSLLTEKEKTTEIARMISGVEITPMSLKHANELLEFAKKIKATT